MYLPTHTRSTTNSHRAKRDLRRPLAVAGVALICSALAVAGAEVSAPSGAAAFAEPVVVPTVDVNPLRPQLPVLSLGPDARDDDGARAARRLQARTPAPTPVVVVPKRVAPKPDGPRMRGACGYRASRQQHPVLDTTQRRNARTIIDLATMLGLPPRAAVIGVATAFQESNLRNLDWGDRDSLGLFQQRPSMGWGTKKLVRTPAFAAAAFYVPLVQTPGWTRMPLTRAAQLIQRSAYPSRYAQWELASAKLVKKQLRVSDAALNCARR